MAYADYIELQHSYLFSIETVKAGRAYLMTIVPNNVMYLCTVLLHAFQIK